MRMILIAGGWSSEREVSLSGARKIEQALKSLGHAVRCLDPASEFAEIIPAAMQADFAFINLHGSPGEDGLIQALLEIAGCPYQGAGPKASFLALNKAAAKAVFARHDLATAAQFHDLVHSAADQDRQRDQRRPEEEIRVPNPLQTAVGRTRSGWFAPHCRVSRITGKVRKCRDRDPIDSQHDQHNRQRIQQHQQSRPLPRPVLVVEEVQPNATFGASRSAGLTTSNSTADWNPNMPANTMLGKVSRLVLYCITASL